MTKLASTRLLLSALTLAAVSARAQSLLVVNQGDSNLSIVDPATGHAVANIPEDIAGVHAHEVTVSADGRTAFLPIYGSSGVGRPGVDGDRMLFVDLTTHKIVGDLHFAHPVRPHLPVLDSKRNLLYVTTELDQSVTVIDPKTRKILGSIPTSQPESHMLVLSHSGRLGYTANVGPGTVSVLDLAGRKTVAVIPVSPKVQRISITNDDKFVFTSDQSKPQLAVIDTATNKVKSWVPLPGTGYGSAATPDGRFVLVAIPSTGQVAVVDLGIMKVARTIDVPKTPQEILIRPDGKVAYVSCNTTGQVAAIDLSQGTVGKLIPTGKLADGLAWAR